MKPKLDTTDFNEDRRNLLLKAMNAFDAEDVDLARRVLIASYHHHTRQTLTPTERLNLWWCLAWFAYYEGCAEKSEKIVHQIIKLEESFVVRREAKIIYAKYVLSIFCSSLGKLEQAEQCKQDAARMIANGNMHFSQKKLLLAQLEAKVRNRATANLQVVENTQTLSATGTSKEYFC